MKIVCEDESILECRIIEIYGDDFVCDEYRIIPIAEVIRIEE